MDAKTKQAIKALRDAVVRIKKAHPVPSKKRA
jgi:hypothetical protein